ncbi:MAG: hypothetical protein H7256_11755 [Bdellovibrio sp.]|nr:hypothetical protein [Bdellovibrio sp.]
MSLIVAIELDPKCAKDLSLGCYEVAELLHHDFTLFQTLEGFRKNISPGRKDLALLIVPLEELGLNPLASLNEIKSKYGCDIVVTVFDHSPLHFDDIELWPIVNFIYKAFDDLILKEHLRFALLPNQKIKTEYVHTSEVKSTIEHLQKVEAVLLSETGFKIKKSRDFVVADNYKFYQPLFTDQFAQNVWAQMVNTDTKHYEFIFSELSKASLLQIRNKIQFSESYKNTTWMGRHTAPQKTIQVLIQLKNPESVLDLQRLFESTFAGVYFIDAKLLDAGQKKEVDLLITDRVYTDDEIKDEFKEGMSKVSIVSDISETKKESFVADTIRVENYLDFAFIVKMLKQLFPKLVENEPNPVAAVEFIEPMTLTENLAVVDFSEASIGFLSSSPMAIGSWLNICLPPNDENALKDFKAHLHYVDKTPNADGFYYHQLVLFGMKDELLKQMRLWARQKFVSIRHTE